VKRERLIWLADNPFYTKRFAWLVFALTNIVLEPASEYSFNILPVFDFGMLFAISPAFATLTDWRMGQTLTGDPWAAGEWLKFAVDASAIPSDALAVATAPPVPLGVSRQATNLGPPVLESVGAS
jgi:hypothetical protein